MSPIPRWRRILRISAICIAVLGIGIAASVSIQQHILRWRAERLLSDIRDVQLGKGTWADAQKFMSRWKDEGNGGRECTEKQCTFDVAIEDPVSVFLDKHLAQNPAQHGLQLLYLLINGRFLQATAVLRIQDGVAAESTYTLFLRVLPGYSHGWHGGSGLVGIEDQNVNGFGPYNFRESRLIHPEYWIGKPGGCEGCVKLMTGFTPLAGRDKTLELTDFNFDCITRWTACTTEADIMPSAWKQYEVELPGNQTRFNAFEHCNVPLDFFGREFEQIAVADVISRDVKLAGSNERLPMQLRIVRVLKGEIDWSLGQTQAASVFDRGEAIRGWNSAELIAGKRYIVFGTFSDRPLEGKVLGLEDCGVIPYTEQNLDSIEKGIEASIARDNQLGKR